MIHTNGKIKIERPVVDRFKDSSPIDIGTFDAHIEPTSKTITKNGVDIHLKYLFMVSGAPEIKSGDHAIITSGQYASSITNEIKTVDRLDTHQEIYVL